MISLLIFNFSLAALIIFLSSLVYGIISYYVGLHSYIDTWLKLYNTKVQCCILYIPFGLYINKLIVHIKGLPWI